MIDLIHAIDQPIVAADIVEYNPRCDLSNMTALVAAKLLKEIAGMMVNTMPWNAIDDAATNGSRGG